MLRLAGAFLIGIALAGIELTDPVGGDPDRQHPVHPDPGRPEFVGQHLHHAGEGWEQPIGDGEFGERHTHRGGQHEDDGALGPGEGTGGTAVAFTAQICRQNPGQPDGTEEDALERGPPGFVRCGRDGPCW